jgi:nitroreductase
MAALPVGPSGPANAPRGGRTVGFDPHEEADMANAPVPSPAPSLMVAAQVAQRAPSVFNTQPWRWRAGADLLELHADRSRRLVVARVGYPYLVLRFSTRAAAADLPAAPRRDPADVIDETD